MMPLPKKLPPKALLTLAVALGTLFSGAAALASPWDPYLEVLNEPPPPEASPFVSPYDPTVDEDLNARNDRELKAIQADWAAVRVPQGQGVAAGKKPTREEAKALRDKENEFFHRRVQALNDQTFALLERAAKRPAGAKKDYRDLAVKILAKVAQNPVANLESTQSYDQGGQVGFCFGRALLVHLFLRQAGVPQGDIVKLFNVGQLRVEQQLWRFHVAVMVRDSAVGFLVIDPLQPQPMPYKAWVQVNERYDIKGSMSRARFYATDPRKFLPTFGAYDVKQLEEPVLKKYFDDLAKSLTP